MLRDTDPRGTTKELGALGIDLASTPSCSRQIIENGETIVLGCKQWKGCALKERGLSGPVNKGIQTIKRHLGSKKAVVINNMMTCFHIPGYQRRIENRGGVVNIIASEGEVIKLRGSKARDEVIPGQGLVRVIDDVILEQKVPAFPRPGMGGNLTEEVIASAALEEHKRKMIAARPFELLGLKVDPGDPLYVEAKPEGGDPAPGAPTPE